MIRPPVGHCRTSMAAFMRWSDPVCRVTVMAPTALEALAKENILMKEEKGHFMTWSGALHWWYSSGGEMLKSKVLEKTFPAFSWKVPFSSEIL